MMGANQTKTLAMDSVSLSSEGPFSQIPSRVDKVNVEGVVRTQADIILDGVDVLFKANNFMDVLEKVNEAKTNLQRIGAFSVVETSIDTSRGPEATSRGLEVTFHVKEISRIAGGLNTSVGTNEGSVTLVGKTPNVVGRGEKLQLDYNYGMRKTSGIHLSLSKPVWRNGVYGYLTGSVFQDGLTAHWAGFNQVNRGTLVDLLLDRVYSLKHNIQYEACWRELKCLSRSTAFKVREETGHTLKSSLRYILTYDNRDSNILPYGGQLVKLTSEYAGLGGDTQFLKNELHIQANKNLVGDFVLQGALQAGILTGLKAPNAHISDKFFLGGPLNLRGFEMWSCGPQSDNCFLGAESYWSTALHLYAPLPFTNPQPGSLSDFFRTHIFANCGNIGDIRELGNDFNEVISQLLFQYRATVGIGIVIRIADFARFELNYCHPIASCKTDKAVHGLQFGVGISYL